MNLYIFAIGGSGSRVLRSLTMLLASGIETNNNIIPIIIDPDTSNGDLDRTVTAMRMYETVRNELKFDDCYKNKFFSANVTALNNDGNYLLPLVGTSGINFDKYLGLGQCLRKIKHLQKCYSLTATCRLLWMWDSRAILTLEVLYLTSSHSQRTLRILKQILLQVIRFLLSVQSLEEQEQVGSP